MADHFMVKNGAARTEHYGSQGKYLTMTSCF